MYIMNKFKKKMTVSTSHSKERANRLLELARVATLGLLMLLPLASEAQRLLTLDSCRAMALRNNKQMGVANVDESGDLHPE